MLGVCGSLLFIFGCGKASLEVKTTMIPSAALQSARVLFLHKSVGRNILEGVALLQSQIPIRPLDKFDLATPLAPGIYETSAGDNGDPLGKIRRLEQLVITEEYGKAFDIAILKFCYVDIIAASDSDSIFQAYRAAITRIKTAYPQLKLMHCTAPLTVHNWGLKATIKNLFSPEGDNLQRARYNRLLTAEFKQNNVIFDLAAREATRPDGKLAFFKQGTEQIPELYKGYSSDGGHLNETGKKIMAAAFLKSLDLLAADR
jgi:hypothetical protein